MMHKIYVVLQGSCCLPSKFPFFVRLCHLVGFYTCYRIVFSLMMMRIIIIIIIIIMTITMTMMLKIFCVFATWWDRTPGAKYFLSPAPHHQNHQNQQNQQNQQPEIQEASNHHAQIVPTTQHLDSELISMSSC